MLEEFLKIFSMGFRKIEKNLERRFFYRNRGPGQQADEMVDIGICDICDNFSYSLKPDASNHMACERCRWAERHN